MRHTTSRNEEDTSVEHAVDACESRRGTSVRCKPQPPFQEGGREARRDGVRMGNRPVNDKFGDACDADAEAFGAYTSVQAEADPSGCLDVRE